ncbi:MAG: diphosphomevalonate decarboxylase [Polyangiaceae bacterium]|nr:diphosphomevalonate decarboxylase [Polyangiaceae bacterium]
MSGGRARVVACSNIALAKYWGKADEAQNLTAVPSLSLTLDALRTTTEVAVDATLQRDELILGGRAVAGRPLARAAALLERVRALSGSRLHARVTSENDFPTASGLASSASGFAALALAAARAYGAPLGPGALSAVARRGSASAARSLHGGFVELLAGAEEARQLAPETHWDVRMVVAVTTLAAKGESSTSGMLHTARTSPYYGAWLEHAPRLFEEIRAAVLARDLAALGPAMEQSALAMHASMLASRPAVIYLNAASLAALARVRALREVDGVSAWATMDAGPHVKVLASAEDAPRVRDALLAVAGVERTIVSAPGPAARVIEP